MATNIDAILAKSGSRLFQSAVPSIDTVRERSVITKQIAAAYPAFEGVRDMIVNQAALNLTPLQRSLVHALCDEGLVRPLGNQEFRVGIQSKRFLMGGWLEEYVALAVAEIGADEVLIGQKVAWRVGEFDGENEIDVMARFAEKLFICSCKALRSALRPNDARLREQLMSALHEADNLADHFAPSGGITCLAVTTDLKNEGARLARYQQLHGKAAVLGVHLITLEDMTWPVLIRRIADILTDD